MWLVFECGKAKTARKSEMKFRDVSTGATGATEVAPSDILTLSSPGGQILPTIAEVASKFSLRLRPSIGLVNFDLWGMEAVRGQKH